MIRENLLQRNNISIDTENRNKCKTCGLCRNQQPLFDRQKMSSVVWLGLSAVKIINDQFSYPLSPDTKTGSLLYKIESSLDKTAFYRTNLVKCLPLCDEKIRYPKGSEMESCFPVLEVELSLIKPGIVFLLGNQVSKFILNKYNITAFNLDPDFNYTPVMVEDVMYVPVHHPSFILVYKRKYTEKYVKSIAGLIRSSLQDSTLQPASSNYNEPVVLDKFTIDVMQG